MGVVDLVAKCWGVWRRAPGWAAWVCVSVCVFGGRALGIGGAPAPARVPKNPDPARLVCCRAGRAKAKFMVSVSYLRSRPPPVQKEFSTPRPTVWERRKKTEKSIGKKRPWGRKDIFISQRGHKLRSELREGDCGVRYTHLRALSEVAGMNLMEAFREGFQKVFDQLSGGKDSI